MFDTIDPAKRFAEIGRRVSEIRKTADGTPFPYPLTDSGNAERFADQHGGHLRYVTEWGDWLAYNGQHWTTGAESDANVSAVWTARAMLVDAVDQLDPDKRARLTKHALSSESYRGISSVVRLARALLSISSSVLDADRMLFNVLNGTIDLRTGKLRPHAAGDLITKLAPVTYDAAATCPLFEQFLAKVLPSAAVRRFVQLFFGYALTGDVTEQVLAFFYGSGANGKSTLLTVIQHIFGDYAKQGAPDLLLMKHGETHPTEQTDLEGARLVICSEVEAGRRLAEVRVKQLTGGDKIRARRMRQDFYEFAPTHKLILGANHRPQVRGADHALWRRVRTAPFDVTIPLEDRDAHLVDKLKAEAPGILAWIVRGCLEWQRDGLVAPSEVTQATESYREDQDLFGQFLEDRCEVAPDAWESSSDLFQAFNGWCIELNHRPWEQRGFSDALLEHGMIRKKVKRAGRDIRGFLGVRLKTARVAPVISLVSPKQEAA